MLREIRTVLVCSVRGVEIRIANNGTPVSQDQEPEASPQWQHVLSAMAVFGLEYQVL